MITCPSTVLEPHGGRSVHAYAPDESKTPKPGEVFTLHPQKARSESQTPPMLKSLLRESKVIATSKEFLENVNAWLRHVTSGLKMYFAWSLRVTPGMGFG